MKLSERIINGTETLLEYLMPRKRHSAAVQREGAETVYKKVQPTQHGQHIFLLPYRGQVVKHLIHAMKYEKHRMSIATAADLLHRYLTDEIQEQESIHTMQYIVCTIPLTQERKRANGFDHLDALLRAVDKKATAAGIPLQNKRHLLRWNREVKRQSRLKNRSERLNNVRNAMTAVERIPANTICFVVDDVTTTGATLTEARRTLTESGAHTVITVALAH